MNNKNLNQGGVPSCVPDDKCARQDSNLFNFPLKRAHQLQKKLKNLIQPQVHIINNNNTNNNNGNPGFQNNQQGNRGYVPFSGRGYRLG